MCICSCLTKFFSNLQLWLILRPNCLTKLLLTPLYTFDLLTYTFSGPKEFLTKRAKLLGKNFAALGKIIVGEHAQVSEIIDSPQTRGHFLGRARLSAKRMPKYFSLFLSDEDADSHAPNADLHGKLHEHVWASIVPAAMGRVYSDPAFAEYIDSGIEKSMSLSRKDAKKELRLMTIKYVYHALFGESIADQPQVIDAFHTLFFSGSPGSDYVSGAVAPLSNPYCCCRGSRNRDIKITSGAISQSPLLSGYTPSEENGKLSRDHYIELLLALSGIAGMIGTSTLCIRVVEAIPDNLDIDLENPKDVMLAVFEAARTRAPVNNINVLLPAERSMIVNGKQCRLKVGTVVAGSIGLASLDPDVFENPEHFDPKRENLLSATLNFNSVGFSAETDKRRVCPGRNIAMKMACDLLQAKRLLK